MRLKSKKVKVAMVVLGALLICSLGGFLGAYISAGSGSMIAEAGNMLSLSRPAFAQGAGTTFLDEEAGMSIYTDTDQPLDLSVARTVYKTIEIETADYIVGSVALPDLPESDDVHIFVHKDGWIVVYYLSAEPVSKVIDWNYYSAGKLTKTKLQVGLEEMCYALGVTPTDINYYHFQYPYATKWMIITESQEGLGTDSFNLKIPSEFTFYERSWSHRGGSGTATEYGLLTLAQLIPDIFHTVEVTNGGSYGVLKSYFKLDGQEVSYIYGGEYSDVSYIAVALVYLEP